MFQIVKSEKLADKIYLMDVKAPRVAHSCQPGEFVIVKMDEKGERIPLTICDYDREAGTITIVIQTVGASTEKMVRLKAGEYFEDVVGPLGNPSEFVHEDVEELKKKKYLFVAGGVGTAPVYPQVKWFHEHGLEADVIVGAKTKDLVILDPMFLIQVFVFPKIEEVNLPDSEILCPELLHLELLYQEPLYSELPDPVNLDSVFLYLVFNVWFFRIIAVRMSTDFADCPIRENGCAAGTIPFVEMISTSV